MASPDPRETRDMSPLRSPQQPKDLKEHKELKEPKVTSATPDAVVEIQRSNDRLRVQVMAEISEVRKGAQQLEGRLTTCEKDLGDVKNQVSQLNSTGRAQITASPLQGARRIRAGQETAASSQGSPVQQQGSRPATPDWPFSPSVEGSPARQGAQMADFSQKAEATPEGSPVTAPRYGLGQMRLQAQQWLSEDSPRKWEEEPVLSRGSARADLRSIEGPLVTSWNESERLQASGKNGNLVASPSDEATQERLAARPVSYSFGAAGAPVRLQASDSPTAKFCDTSAKDAPVDEPRAGNRFGVLPPPKVTPAKPLQTVTLDDDPWRPIS